MTAVTPAVEDIDVSVIVVSWNTRELTSRCLAAIRRETVDVRAEIVVVDNGSRDGSAAVLGSDPSLTMLANQDNRGFAAAVNQAQRLARGRFVAVINSDLTLHPGSLPAMITFLTGHPTAVAVSPTMIDPDGGIQDHFVRVPGLLTSVAMFTALRRLPVCRRALDRFSHPDLDRSRPIPLLSGSAFLLGPTALRDEDGTPVPIFDESFPVFFNDAVLVDRLLSDGGTVWTLPGATATHQRGASCRRLGGRARYRHLIAGMVRYLRRDHAGRLPLLSAALLADHLLRRLLHRPTVLTGRDLVRALLGRLGPLPDGDTRDWVITADARPGPIVPDERRMILCQDADLTRLQISRPDRNVWRSEVPRGRGRRRARRQLRDWLDDHAGALTVVGPDARRTADWLGVDTEVGTESMRASTSASPSADRVMIS